MLTDLSYEQVWNDQSSVWPSERVLSFAPQDWIVYFNFLGFDCDFVALDGEAQESHLDYLPIGLPYFCATGLPLNHPNYDDHNTHAVAIDRNGIVFDPAKDVPSGQRFQEYRRAISPAKIKTIFSVLDRRLRVEGDA